MNLDPDPDSTEPKTMSTIPRTYDEAHQWIMERVGNVVHRGPAWKGAKAPDLANHASILVTDVLHAQYLLDCSMECGVIYQDEPVTQ